MSMCVCTHARAVRVSRIKQNTKKTYQQHKTRVLYPLAAKDFSPLSTRWNPWQRTPAHWCTGHRPPPARTVHSQVSPASPHTVRCSPRQRSRPNASWVWVDSERWWLPLCVPCWRPWTVDSPESRCDCRSKTTFSPTNPARCPQLPPLPRRVEQSTLSSWNWFHKAQGRVGIQWTLFSAALSLSPAGVDRFATTARALHVLRYLYSASCEWNAAHITGCPFPTPIGLAVSRSLHLHVYYRNKK